MLSISIVRFGKTLLSLNNRNIIHFVENRFSQHTLINTVNSVAIDVRKSEILWRRQKTAEKFYNHLHECFLRNKDSSTYIVNLLRHACDRNSCSSEHVYNMITAFTQYVKTYSIEFVPTKEQKTEILNSVLHYRNYQLLKHACEAFKITEEQKSSFKELISSLLQQERLAEAAYCISVLKLHDEYRIEEIILLLLYEGKWKTAMGFLKDYPDLQQQTAKVLDNLLGNNGDAIPMSVKNRKILKALNSLVKNFKIPPEECKNLHFFRSRSAINLLIRRREQQSITDAAWEEMIMKIVGDNRSLKEHLLYKLVTRGDEESALKMKEKLNMPDFDFSTIPVTRIAGRSGNEMDEDVDLEDDTDHLTFNLSLSDIKFVDTKQNFIDCIADLSQNYNMIGIDCEWKAHFGLAQDRLALVQLATHDKVYILDIISLTECLEAEDWDKLMDDIFGSSKIIKLGFNILTDIHMIVENNRGTKEKTVRFSHILDMAVFYQKLQEVYPTEMSDGDDNNSLKGLSNLCKIILGKPLNKGERLCDWEKRPLKDTQLEYAALDAYCLLQMYDELKKIALEKNINFDHLARVAMVVTASIWKPKRKLGKEKNQNNTHMPKSILIHQFKVVVHPQFHLLGKQLSQLGADVLFLDESSKASDAALIARSQERILICSEEFKNKVLNISLDILCFVSKSHNENHFLSQILQKYNVSLTAKKVFRQCANCSCEESLQLSPEELNLIKEQERDLKKYTISGDRKSSKYLYGSLQRAITNMVESGIQININDQSSNLSQNVFLCIKCGLVQS